MISRNRYSMSEVLSHNRGDGSDPDLRSSCDSMQSSGSQHCPQFEFSQVNSQDFFTQQSVGGSQPEVTQSQGKKAYDRYMSLPPLFKNKSTGNNQVISCNEQRSKPKPNYQEQIETNKVKAKERDERDLLHSIVRIVKDCTDEVRHVLTTVKENIDHKLDSSEIKLEASVQNLNDGVLKSYDRMLQALKERDVNKGQVHELEKEITKKDSKITELERQIKSLQSEENEKMIESLRETYSQQQVMTERKLQKILEMAKDHMRQHKDQTALQQLQADEQGKQQDMQSEVNQHQMMHMEKRISEELKHLLSDLKTNQSQVEQYYKQHLQRMHGKQVKELEGLMRRELSENVDSLTDQSKQLYQKQQNQFQEVCKKQHDDLNEFVQTQVKDLNKSQEEKLQRAIRDIQDLQVSSRGNHDVIKSPSALAYMGDRIKNYSKDMQLTSELATLHERHQAEVERLIKEQEARKSENAAYSRRKARSEIVTDDEFKRPYSSSVYEGNSRPSYSVQCSKAYGNIFSSKDKGNYNKPKQWASFISPGTIGWKSAQTGGPLKPSPVATVFPQQHVCTAQNSSQDSIDHQYEPNQFKKQQNPKKRKRANYAAEPQRRSQRLTRSKKSTEDLESSKPKHSKSGSRATADNYSTLSYVAPLKPAPCGMSTSRSYSKGMHSYNTSNSERNVSSVYEFNDETDYPARSFVARKSTINRSGGSTDSGIDTEAEKQHKTSRSVNDQQQRVNPVPARKGESSSDNEFGSCGSSPSLSVTEVVVRRKVKIPSTVIRNSSGSIFNGYFASSSQNSDGDFLSTPNLKSSLYKEDKWMHSQAVPSSNIRRSEEKRRLFNYDADSDIMKSIWHQKLPKNIRANNL